MEDFQPAKKSKKLLAKYSKFGVILILTLAVGIYLGQNFVFQLSGTPSVSRRSTIAAANIKNKDVPSNIDIDFSLFWKVWDQVSQDYLDKSKVDPQKLYYGAIKGMVNSLEDPYTVFLDPDQNKNFNTQLSGTFEGVGMQLGVKEQRLVVMAPIDGTPAALAGVKAGDFIVKIDSKDATNLSLYEAVNLIRGPAGTEIKITFAREGTPEPFEKVIKRATIKVKSVELTPKDKVAVLKINQFGDTTNDEWNQAIEEVRKGNFQKLVLDLRNNPGGRLQSAVHIISAFVDKNKIAVQQEDGSGNKIPLFTQEDARLKNLPVVVLINQGSASAAEIVAGGLRDLRGIILVGEKSFGKGTVQEVQPYEEGGGLHLTTSKWLTPKGTWVHENGLAPDIEVATQKDDSTQDPQLQKALEMVKSQR